MSDIRQTLDRLLARRILLLDGAMGTMVQRHHLTEADFRGLLEASGFSVELAEPWSRSAHSVTFVGTRR